MKNVESLEKEKDSLQTQAESLKAELEENVSSEMVICKELENLKKQVRMLNFDATDLDEILKASGNNQHTTVLGYTSNVATKPITWVKERNQETNIRYFNKFHNKICFKCRLKGHRWRQCKIFREKQRKVLRPKAQCIVTKVSMSANVSAMWYFDSGSPRHMTRNRAFLNDIT